MGFGDDFLAGLQQKVENTISGVSQSASDFIQSKVGDTLIKVGGEPTGNLTPEQLAAGQRPGTPTISPQAFGSINLKTMSPVLIIGGIVVVALLLRRK